MVSGAQPRLGPSSGSVAGSQPIPAVLHSIAAHASPSPALLGTEKHKQDVDNRSFVRVTTDPRAAEHGAAPGSAPNSLVSAVPCQEVLGNLPCSAFASGTGSSFSGEAVCSPFPLLGGMGVL